MAFEGVESLPHFEIESFRFKNKIFATLDENKNRAMLRLSNEDQSLFSLHDKTAIYPVPNKWGKHGATYVELTIAKPEMVRDALRTAYNTNVIYKTGQCFRNHTVVNADGYKCLVQSGEAKIGLLHLSNRYNHLTKAIKK